MKITVAIPTYNNLKDLKRALESVFMQDFEDYEIVITDDSKDNETEDYIKSLPAVYIRTAEHPKLSDAGIYIRAYNSPYYSDMLGFLFFDMKKKHIFGEELPCNVMTLLSSDKLHWKLNEKEGLWFRLEGGPSPYASEEEERRRDEAWELRGFSVPDDVIMIKEE